MKKTLVLVLTLLMLLPVVALAEDLVTYTDPDLGFEISFPEDWTTSIGDEGMFIAVAPDYSLNFNVISIPVGESISSAQLIAELEGLSEEFAQNFEGYEAAADGEIITIGELEFVAFSGFYSSQGSDMQILQLYTGIYGVVHILTFTGNTSVEGFDSDAVDALVIEIIESFVPAKA